MLQIIEEFCRIFKSAESFNTFSEYYVERILAMALTSKMALHPDCHHNCSDSMLMQLTIYMTNSKVYFPTNILEMLSSLIYLLLLQPSIRKTKIVANQDSFVQEFIVFKKVENLDM